ncbi:MAG: hypothetical protein ACPL7B_09750 [Candidatus Poribacteria bacterium]
MEAKKFKIVYTDSYHPTVGPEKSELDEINAELIIADCRTEEEIIAITRDADGLMVQHAKITKKVIKHLNKCKIIARFGVVPASAVCE